jgi:hypothetical protein
MRIRSLFSKWGASASVLAMALSGTARADDELPCVIGKDGVGIGLVFPSPGCKQTVTLDASLSAVANSSEFEPRFGAEVGYFVQTPKIPTLHLGPVLDVLATDSFNDENRDASVDLVLGLRSRWWFGPSYPFMILDAAVGPMVVVPTAHDLPDRVGVYGEMGFGLHGALGVYGSLEPSWSTEDRSFHLRYSIGVKTTAVGVVLAIGVFACAQSGAKCM